MPEAAVAAVVEFIATTGIEVAGISISTATLITIASVYTLREQQRRAQSAQKDAYNASLRDRYVMSRGATEPRQLVLGRQRVSGPITFIQSYGTNREHLVMMLPLAAHEIAAVEAYYFDDEQVIVDGSGNVTGVNRREVFSISAAGAAFTLQGPPKTGTVTAVAKYGTTTVTLGTSVAGSIVTVSGATAGQTGTVTISYQPDPSPFAPTARTNATASITIDGSGNGSQTLANVPVSGSVHVIYAAGGDVGDSSLDAFVGVAGSVVTVTGASPVSITAQINYQYTAAPRARIRTYLGAPGQAADAATISNLPGVWTSAHAGTGIAYLAIELDYDPDAFPHGVPNVSALVRGAKVYDPRTGLTAWSENPALLMRHAATHPLCGRLATSVVNDAAVITAANACDVSTSYVVAGQTYTRARYTAGLVVKAGTRGQDVLNDLAQAMAGKWAFIDGQLKVRAGAWVTPLQTLDDTWLTDVQPVQIQPRANRQDVFNIATGKFADEQSDYQVLDFPRVEAAAYITEDGAQLPADMPLNAVTFTGQAQQVVAAAMRDARQGMRVTLSGNMRAYPVEWGDVIYVTLDRFGWVAKPFEVLDTSFTLDGGIQLSLKETSATIWDVGAAFSAVDPAPNTRLPSPFNVPDIAGLAVDSSNTVQVRNADGTVVQRMRVSWTALAAPGVLGAGGGVEVRYGRGGDAEAQMISRTAEAGQTYIDVSPIQQGQIYLVKARAFNALVNGKWSLPVAATVTARANKATTVQQDTYDFGGTAYTATGVKHSFTFTPDFNCTIEFTAKLAAKIPDFDGGHQALWRVTPNGGGTTTLGYAHAAATTAVRADYSLAESFAATGGVQLTFDVYATVPAGTVTLYESTIRVTAIYQ